MDSAKKQLVDKLKTANNILVTVSRDPSVDQLAACLGLTLLLNKLNKHSVAVFSGKVPSTIEFLKPGETIEKTTDSLRDFIIALDKNKADKLRYKVEDNVVRIFITPYKTSISQEDLEFSQGDFNVDVVVALGVKQQEDLDEAITTHGRILHDAAVASINISPDGGLGTINWHDPQASSLSELVTTLAQALGDNLLDNQVATALLTGIVAETDRFRNDKTSAQTMSASSALMAAGADQQLVANKLEEPVQLSDNSNNATQDKGESDEAAKGDGGTLSIDHAETKDDGKDSQKASSPEKTADQPSTELPPPQPSANDADQIAPMPSAGDHLSNGPQLVTEPPTLGGTLSANTRPEGLDPATDPLSLPSSQPPQLLDHSSVPATPAPQSNPPAPAGFTPPPPTWNPPAPAPASTPSPTPISAPSVINPAPPPTNLANSEPQTLSEIEQSVRSPHTDPAQLDTARDEVSKALNTDGTSTPPAAIQALNAQPLGADLHPPQQPPLPTVTPSREPTLPLGPTPPESSITSPQPAPLTDMSSSSPQVSDPTAPPPVPPPIPFQFGNNQNSGNPPASQ